MSEDLISTKEQQIAATEAILEKPLSESEMKQEWADALAKKQQREEAREETRQEAVGLARTEVLDTVQEQSMEGILGDVDFSEEKYRFSATNSYHGEAKTFDQNSLVRGRSNDLPYYRGDNPLITANTWGDARHEANQTSSTVEYAGVRKTIPITTYNKQLTPRKGLAGKVGLKKWTEVRKTNDEPHYFFDYSFAAPSHGEDAAKRSGNFTGQATSLSLELSKDQAEKLSKMLADDPKAARSVLDHFMRTTGDGGKWNAELYDEQGTFYDPGERYGTELEARDVRPQYDAFPDLEPRIMGLVDVEISKEPTHQLRPAA